MKPLDDAKFSGTKDVDERLKIDSANLQPWIDEYVPNAGNIKAIEQFKGGQSNPTYKIITESKNLVLRRKPPGKLLPSAHAVDREYKVITALYETGVPVPKTYGLCEDDDVAGTAFFIMDFLDGDLFWDPMIPTMTNRDRTQIYKNKNKTLAKLHSVDYKKIGLEDYGKPGNYVARQVSRWSKQYRASETDNIEAMNNLIDWLPKNIPDDDETTIVHGDYRLDNMILKNNEVIGILDWELSTLGHPIADFSYHCLSWRTQEAFWDQTKLKELGIPSEREYMEMYCENSGKDLSNNWEFYMAFNMFKIAGILQGILGRVRDGTAASKHAEERGNMVFPLSEAAWSTIEENFLK
ncbi:MAG: phosphotransferase family protein [SAR86 cluster bacterium]|jgi:aminoglycoside phosphotransferase (APT) family kinase protein|uniref:Phosphotransferase family protein n=1 Tax=SAR86 cluster bacterium TaxID=2030880 RepID=A0A520N2H5_9GAMM|nr:MAG: phosphotransferase family protein [SAR86 cluster bacterium]|tara:strand:+ start:8218 stop:9273 length:1056 start_codon:yes stop_codon:yes gene_type:complete